VTRIAAGGLLLFLALMLGLFAWRLESGKDTSALPSALVGKPLAPFVLPPLAGRAKTVNPDGLALGDLQSGQVHVVNVFSSWCTNCRLESEVLAALSQRGDIALHGIDYKDEPKAGATFLTDFGDPYRRVGFDGSGRVAIDWGVYGVPETFVIDGTGRVVARLAAPLTPENMAQVIEPAIAAAKRANAP
jgi:cytochrome c biogenesis protein CcmG/thiol:disulfide interchange protein DsbE